MGDNKRYSSYDIQKAKNIDTACLQQNAQKYTYSHDNIYHSVLQLLDIKSSTYKSELDLFVNCIEK